jgi:Zn-dependent alcohol dehydrogenase
MRIRAAVLEDFGKPLVVQDLDLAPPAAGEALVRLAACGICHTDMYTASGADPSGYSLTVLGHEGAGVVEAVGEHVGSLEPGDREVTLCGSSFGGVKGRDQVPQLVQRYLDGEIDVDPFVSHRISLDEVNRGFELMEAQDGIRTVIGL